MFGVTGNAAANGLSWSMGSVLPSQDGLDVNGLIYRYSTVKNADDAMKVHIRNGNADGTGYTFSETDDWSGVPGNTITKQFSLPYVPAALWGDGSIDVEGTGEVIDPVVIYSYRFDPCYDPQIDPNCPGYVKPAPPVIEVEVYDALEDESVAEVLEDETEFKYDADGNLIMEEDEEEEETRLEMGLMASANALTLTQAQGQSDLINQINLQTNIAMYYNTSIGGGAYGDVNILTEVNLPDNKKALRNNLAQQLLHEQMVQIQYGD